MSEGWEDRALTVVVWVWCVGLVIAFVTLASDPFSSFWMLFLSIAAALALGGFIASVAAYIRGED